MLSTVWNMGCSTQETVQPLEGGCLHCDICPHTGRYWDIGLREVVNASVVFRSGRRIMSKVEGGVAVEKLFRTPLQHE